MSSKLLPSLIRTNQAILKQKQSLIHLLRKAHIDINGSGSGGASTHSSSSSNDLGSNLLLEQQATKLFTHTCPIVKASIGGHFRHSMDHMELAALVASNAHSNTTTNNGPSSLPVTLHYDLRIRGGLYETNVKEAEKRIVAVHDILQEIYLDHANTCTGTTNSESTSSSSSKTHLTEQCVNASFMLSSDSDEKEMELKSTIGRELAFAAHHAIHHLAMVKIIAINLGVKEEDLPLNFGRAPSTIRFDQGT